MARRRGLDTKGLIRLGKVFRYEAEDLLSASLEGERGEALRRLFSPETLRGMGQVVTPEALTKLGSAFFQEATDLAIDTAGKARALPAVDKALDPETRAQVEEILRLLREAALEPIDPDVAQRDDLELIKRLVPPLDALMRGYFRLEVDGIDQIPHGSALLVSNHDAGSSAVQILGFGARFHLERSYDERIVGLMHDTLFEVPYFANVLGHLGAIRASHEAANDAFRRGHKVYVAPGGSREAFRPYKERHRIKFGGRRGWVRLAHRNGVPVVPIVYIGGQETFFVLNDGEYLAHNLGLKKRFRLDTFPIWLGLPFGVGLGPVFHLPLPSKCKVRILEPYDIAPRPGETDSELEARVYEEVTAAMQSALDDMAAERTLPVLG